MTVPAVRFESLSRDFNLPQTSFQSIRDSEILNAPLDAIKEGLESAKGLLSQLKETAKNAMSKVKGILDSVTRFTQNIFDMFADIAKLPEALLNEVLQALLPDDFGKLGAALRGMTKVCRDNALGSALGFGNLSPAKCGGMNLGFGNCPPNSAMTALGAAGVSGLNGLLKAASNVLAKVLALGNIGFNANLCNIFAAITEGIGDLGTLTSAAGILANQQGRKGNLGAVFDISKTVAAKGLNVGASFPETVKNITSGMKNLGGNVKNAAINVGASVMGSLEALDNNWLKSGDGRDSIEKLANNQTFGSVTSMQLGSNSFDVNNMNVVNSNPVTKTLSAYSAKFDF